MDVGRPIPATALGSFASLWGGATRKAYRGLLSSSFPEEVAMPNAVNSLGMCGRMQMVEDWSELKIPCPWVELEAFKDSGPQYNIAPTDPVWTVDGEDQPKLCRWGLIPFWAKSAKKPLINARVETIDQKPAFKGAFSKRRCLVPVSGFYEWRSEGGQKQPYLFRTESKLMFLAGIRSGWKSPQGEKIEACAVITGPGKGLIEEYHNRMPKILPPSAFELWLSPDASLGELHEILEMCALKNLKPRALSQTVNNVRNKGPECLE